MKRRANKTCLARNSKRRIQEIRTHVHALFHELCTLDPVRLFVSQHLQTSNRHIPIHLAPAEQLHGYHVAGHNPLHTTATPQILRDGRRSVIVMYRLHKSSPIALVPSVRNVPPDEGLIANVNGSVTGVSFAFLEGDDVIFEM